MNIVDGVVNGLGVINRLSRQIAKIFVSETALEGESLSDSESLWPIFLWTR